MIAKHALNLAKTDINAAMDLIHRETPTDFIKKSYLVGINRQIIFFFFFSVLSYYVIILVYRYQKSFQYI